MSRRDWLLACEAEDEPKVIRPPRPRSASRGPRTFTCQLSGPLPNSTYTSPMTQPDFTHHSDAELYETLSESLLDVIYESVAGEDEEGYENDPDLVFEEFAFHMRRVLSGSTYGVEHLLDDLLACFGQSDAYYRFAVVLDAAVARSLDPTPPDPRPARVCYSRKFTNHRLLSFR